MEKHIKIEESVKLNGQTQMHMQIFLPYNVYTSHIFYDYNI